MVKSEPMKESEKMPQEHKVIFMANQGVDLLHEQRTWAAGNFRAGLHRGRSERKGQGQGQAPYNPVESAS